ERIRGEATTDWDDTIAAERFTDTGGRLIRGTARLIAPRTVQVGDQQIRARRAVILNTGTNPAVPPIPGLAEAPYWTNRDALRATEAPASMVVLGGGPIGVELAQAFSRFGTQVQIVEAAERILTAEEPQASQVLTDALEADGIEVHTGTAVQEVRTEGDGVTVQMRSRDLHAERLLVAAGRTTGLDRLGLETVGLEPSAHTLDVDEYCRVRGSDGEVLADLYAIGDVTGRGPFTHMSVYQAQVALGHLTGTGTYAAEYHAVPRVTFTEPEVGAVGMTRAQAEQRDIPVRVATAELPSSPRGWIHSEGNSGFITLVGHTESGVLLGATSVGPTGGEVLSMLTLAVDQGVTVPALATMIYAYPTFHRAVLTAAQQWQDDA
ncbi:MAG TPA: NAD(P)/FAD-dependent oxidoreductase, partial [Ruania sp.]|nr:NAD(P)/FAD-dependent oxidoreductase [Ruania sp.]